MRSNGWMALVVLVLVAGAVRLPISRASSKVVTTRPGPMVARASDAAVDRGQAYGREKADAEELAWVKARDLVRKRLQERFDAPDWQPREDQLDRHFLEQYGVVQVQAAQRPKEADWEASYSVQLKPDYLGEVRRVARMDRIEQRHLVLARALVGAVALLLVTTAYLRLEEMTRGYATQLLRFAAIALLTIVGVGLFLTI